MHVSMIHQMHSIGDFVCKKMSSAPVWFLTANDGWQSCVLSWMFFLSEQVESFIVGA